MELNNAQLLVHEDATIAQFRVDHNIPNDVMIERFGPNEDANWEVMSLCHLIFMKVSVNFVRTVLAVDVLMKREGKEFIVEDLFHMCFVDSALGSREDLTFVLLQPKRRRDSGIVDDKEVNVKVEDGEESGGRGSVKRLIIPTCQQAEGEAACGRAFSSAEGEGSWQLGHPEVWAPKFAAIELGKQVTNADSSMDHETCLAFGNTIMLPQNMANLDGEGSEEFKDKLIMQGIQIHQLAVLNSKRLKKYSTNLKKVNQRWVKSSQQLNKALQENVELKRVASKEMRKALLLLRLAQFWATSLVGVEGRMLMFDVASGNELGRGKVEGVAKHRGLGARSSVSDAFNDGPSSAEMALRQWEDLVAILWKIVSSLSRVELSSHCWLVSLCPQKFYNMKLQLDRIIFLFKATNSPIADKQSTAVLLVSGIADLHLP
ncbi:hypothetical protein Acr_07g0012160 [Actinidia rufa]|uniref:Uncharacterized protein n=1 Tax=Actinidia rufa TaxID=165716 RepID=A0A7J0EX94_9ERIC|nr:hypothetical protein Acr_07g0012160 [Actinidia rufa]